MKAQVTRASDLADAIEEEVYYGFNLRCVLAEMAHDTPIGFAVVEDVFRRAKLEREEAKVRRLERERQQRREVNA